MSSPYSIHTDPELPEGALVPRHVYLAGPFFNSDQVDQIRDVEEELERYQLKYFSPRLECRYRVGDDPIVALRAKELNRHHISHCGLVLACLSWPDVGTSWELGYAEALGRLRVGFTSNPKVGLNLMIRYTVHRFIQLGAVPNLLSQVSLDIQRGRSYTNTIISFPEFVWKGDME